MRKQPHLCVRREFHSSLLRLDILHKTYAHKESIVFSWAPFRWAHSRKVYLFKESRSLVVKIFFFRKVRFNSSHNTILSRFSFFSLSHNKDPLCGSAPEFKHDRTQSVSRTLGHSVVLTCTASMGINRTASDCEDHLEWMKDSILLNNLTIYPQNSKEW